MKDGNGICISHNITKLPTYCWLDIQNKDSILPTLVFLYSLIQPTIIAISQYVQIGLNYFIIIALPRVRQYQFSVSVLVLSLPYSSPSHNIVT